MDTMTQDAGKASATELAVGVLTPEQAAAQLAFAFQHGPDPVLQLKRLICRGGLRAVQVGGHDRITVEALKDFLANGPANAAILAKNGLPAETTAALFPMEGGGFRRHALASMAETMGADLAGEVRKQLPPVGWVQLFLSDVYSDQARLVGLDLQEMVNNRADPEKAEWARGIQDLARQLKTAKPGETFTIQAKVTPGIKAILERPLPPAGGVFNFPDSSMFQNVGELWFTQRLQWWVMRDLATFRPGAIASGLGALYASPEEYLRITSAALETLPSIVGGFSDSLVIQGGGQPEVRITLAMPDAALKDACGTNDASLVRLAF